MSPHAPTVKAPTLLVMAAGIGSRYGGLKQIDPVGPSGETLLDYSVYDALRAGFGRVVFLIRKDIEIEFREAVGGRFEARADVRYAFQELDMLPAGFVVPPGRTKPWGTTHAVICAEPAIEGPFAAINADDFYGAGSFRVLADHLRSGSQDWAMVGFTLRNTLSDHGSVARGVCSVGPDGYLTGVTELTKIERDGDGARYTDGEGRVHTLTGDETVSMNMWGCSRSVFWHLKRLFEGFLREHGDEQKSEFYMPVAAARLIEEGVARVKVLPTGDPWMGVTYREDRPAVEAGIRKLVEAGKYPERLWE